MRKGLWSAILAFSCWGLFPVYWKIFHELNSMDLFFHRILWSFVTLILLAILRKNLSLFKEIWTTPKRKWLIISAVMISSNWLIYIKAVTEGHILEASMGYFLNPLFNILIGSMFLKENIRKSQIPAVIFAFLGVIYLGYSSGLQEIPWIALSLSITFALYSVIRKLVKVSSLDGLTFETCLVFIPFCIYWFSQGGSFDQTVEALGFSKLFFLMLSGIITCIPLVLFAYAAKNLSLQTLGFTQYLSPSLKFLCGWIIFQEPLSHQRLTSFICIWIGLIYYTLEAIYFSRAQKH